MTKRNYFLDIIKLVASFFVVFIHVTFPGAVGESIKAFSGFAVPLFFITSGYFSQSLIDNKDYKKIFSRIKAIMILLIISLIAYSVVYIALNDFNSFFSFFFQKDSYIKLFVFNNFENTFFTPLWFLAALIYTYFVIFFILKANLSKAIYLFPLLLIPLIIICDIIIKKHDLSFVLYNNFIFKGVPYFSVGYIIKKHYNTNNKVKIISSVAFIVLTVLFFTTYKTVDISATFNVLVSISLFLVALSYSISVKSDLIKVFLDKLSMYIYLIHWPLHNILCFTDISEINAWLYPFVTLALTILVSLLCVLVFNYPKYIRSKNR